MQLPTLVIAGAQKSGTTTLAAALGTHPQIFMSNPKEIHFFDNDAIFNRGLDFYKSHFRPEGEQVHAGEATPIYMYDRKSRRRMAKVLDDTRIVVILRDPVKRAYSHYWHERRRHETIETFEEALDAEPGRLAGPRVPRLRFSYVDRGRYLDQLEPIAEAHGRERVHVMLMEEFLADPTTSLAGLLEFLDLDPATAADLDVEHRNAYQERDESGQVRPAAYPSMLPETKQRLVEEFREPNARLAAWLGRDLAPWTTD